MFKLITHIIFAMAAVLMVPHLVDTFGIHHQHLVAPITALAVALTLIPAIKPIFE